MKDTGEFRNKSVAIIGIGRAGAASARALSALGASVTLYDAKPLDSLGELAQELAAEGFRLEAGDPSYPGLEAAEVVVPSPGVRPNATVLAEARQRGAEVMGEIEVAYRIADAPIIAITGTNGKSTTTAMCGLMLESDFLKTWVGGNLAPGEPLPSLAMKAQAGDTIVGEVSSFQLEQISSFTPKVAILTNLTPDHFDRHESLAEYGAAKARIFQYQAEDDFAVVHADFLEMPELGLSSVIRSRVSLYAYDRDQVDAAMRAAERMGLRAEAGGWVEDGWLVFSRNGESVRVAPVTAVPVPGRHNVENALAAGLAAWLVGAKPDGIRSGLERFQPVAHRMEPVGCVDGVLYVNNSMCTNPAALVASLQSYEQPVILISGGKNKNLDFGEAGAQIAQRAKVAVLIGVAAEEMEKAIGTDGAVVRRAGSLDDAVSIARSLADPGDVVMLAPGCASMDMFHDFMDRGQQFVEAVQRLETAPVGAAG